MSDEPVLYAVDDDAPMRAALLRLFNASGIPAVMRSSAQDLLDSAPFAPRGAFLLDVNMPGMSGIELARVLKERGVTLPIVFLTGVADVPMAVDAMRDGAFDFLEKPFDNVDLVTCVRRAFAASATEVRRGGGIYAQRRALLTRREREVLDGIVAGKTSRVIGTELGISFRTVEVHRANVMDKMGAASMVDLVRMSLLQEGP